MRRLDVHAIEPGEYGQVLTTRVGEAVWETFDINGGDGAPMSVLGWSEAYHQSRPDNGTTARGPYTVPMPAEVDASFRGQLILIVNWEHGPGEVMLGGFDAFDPSWTQLAYAGDSLNPSIGIFGSPPREGDVVEIDTTGNGPCHLVLIAVENARGFRSIPLAATRLISDAETVDGWTTPGPHPIEQVTGTPNPYADTTYVQVRPDHAGTNMAELSWSPPEGTDLTDYNMVEVVWEYAGNLSVDASFEAYSGGQRLRSFSHQGGSYGGTETLYVPDAVVGDLTFRFGPFWEDADFNRFRVKRVTALPFTNADARVDPGDDDILTMSHGVDAVAGDLAFIVSADATTGEKTHVIDTPGAVPLVSRTNTIPGEYLHTFVWVLPVTADMSIQPTTTITPFSGFTHLAAAVVRNTGAGGSGISMTLDQLEDVQTGGAADGKVLTFDGQQWVARDVTGAGATVLGELDDVDLTGIEVGQILVWDGTTWLPAAPPAGTGSIYLGDLDDVDEAVAAPGQALVWDGTEWKPTTLPGFDAEQVRDTVAAMLQAGANINITVDDPGNTVTITSTAPAPLTLEQVQDAVAAMLLEGTGVDLAYDDAAGTLTVTATGGGGGGASTLNELTDVDTTGATAGQVLGFDGTQWEPIDPAAGGGGASTLDALTDVTSPAPGDGYVLTYDAATGQWVPRPGGGAVGAWENDKNITVTPRAMTEVNLAGATIPIPTARPAAAQVEITVSAANSPTDNDLGAVPLGYSKSMRSWWSIDGRAGGTGTISYTLEVTVNGVVVGTFTRSTTTNSTKRTTFSSSYPDDLKTGDVVQFRIWSNGTGNVLDWYMWQIVPNRWGTSLPPAGGVFLYRDLNLLGRAPSPAPATPPAFAGGTSVTTNDTIFVRDGSLAPASNILDVARTYVGPAASGSGLVWRNEVGLNTGGGQITAADSTTQIVMSRLAPDLQVRVDRLAIPTPP